MSANIYHPSRGGVRGGKDQFNWDDVKEDKDRENYLGNLILYSVCSSFIQNGGNAFHYTL